MHNKLSIVGELNKTVFLNILMKCVYRLVSALNNNSTEIFLLEISKKFETALKSHSSSPGYFKFLKMGTEA
jgi:hypothetical protein